MSGTQEKIGFGNRLRAAREVAHLSQDAVAESLHLEKSYIAALELENHQALPAPTFVRGYIRAYARLLGCDADELITLYNQQCGEQQSSLNISPTKSGEYSRHPIFLMITVAMIAVLLALLIMWSRDFINTSKTPLTVSPNSITTETAEISEPNASEAGIDMPPTVALVTDTVSTVTEPTAQPDGSEAQTIVDEPEFVAVIKEEVPTTEAVSEADAVQVASTDNDTGTREITPIAPSGEDRVVLRFTGESWVEMFDANGYRLVFGLYDETARPLSLQGTAPFQLTLGDATHVDITVNEADINIQPYIRSNKTARFLVELPAAMTVNRP